MTKTLYSATSKYVKEINNLPVKRQVSVSGILKKLGVSRSGYNAWKKTGSFGHVCPSNRFKRKNPKDL